MFDFLKRKTEKNSGESVKYIKSISLSNISEIPPVKEEMKEGNIVILNLSKFIKNNGRKKFELRHIIEELTYFSKLNNGEIAQLGLDYLILTPGPEIQFYKK